MPAFASILVVAPGHWNDTGKRCLVTRRFSSMCTDDADMAGYVADMHDAIAAEGWRRITTTFAWQ
ncbi:MAG: hypothetical protein KIS79_12745 [Burkholderiales bacterium]|nr:hypothetical protein [Burkholderiales bacterium]